MKKIKMLRNVPADHKSGSVAYKERQVVTVDDATAVKLLNRSRPLAVLVEDVKPQSTPEAFYDRALKQAKPVESAPVAEPKPKIESAKPQAKPSKQ